MQYQCKYCKVVTAVEQVMGHPSPMPEGWMLAKNDMFRYVCDRDECKEKENKGR